MTTSDSGGQGNTALESKGDRHTYVSVDLGAIAGNVKTVKELLPWGCRLMAVVKADAYGHGAVPVARQALAAGADWLGVALAQEALELRQAGIQAPILVLGVAAAADYERLLAADIRITLCSSEQAHLLVIAAARLRRPALAHVKIDSGMGRIGFFPSAAAKAEILELAKLPGLILEGCFTHFARADEADGGSREGQLAIFRAFLAQLRDDGLEFPIAHCANTAMILAMAAADSGRPPAGIADGFDMARLGIGMYGLYPSAVSREWGVPLTPALAWKSRLCHVKWLPAGAALGYGHTWRAAKDTLVGTVPLGYADGFSRRLSNRGQVLVGGREAPVIGRVCMDQFMVDLSGTPAAQAGDEVALIGVQGGEALTAEDMAALLDTINYEVVCKIGSRVPRRYDGG
ncbi:MAG: alanine racemase [Peptococcaceae bacterium]|jgi:alanine racemase|nr:alanine racemase [Peptococcaceae bacterium]